jgi:hypothetical protein
MTLRLEDRDHTLLRLLTIMTGKSANQIIVDLLRAEYSRVFPDSDDTADELSHLSARDLFRQATGREPPEITPEIEAAFQAALRRAEKAAQEFYGAGGQAAA